MPSARTATAPRDLQGFESWDEPIAIFAWSEADVPTHCRICGVLIPHALTEDGHAYVRDRIERREGRADALNQWAVEYGYALQGWGGRPMDANEVLAELRHLAAIGNRPGAGWTLRSFGGYFRMLDAWLTRGHRLPDAWRDADRNGAPGETAS
jgi:hypothetical protein